MSLLFETGATGIFSLDRCDKILWFLDLQIHEIMDFFRICLEAKRKIEHETDKK